MPWPSIKATISSFRVARLSGDTTSLIEHCMPVNHRSSAIGRAISRQLSALSKTRSANEFLPMDVPSRAILQATIRFSRRLMAEG